MANEEVLVFIGILAVVALVVGAVFTAQLPLPLVLAAFLVILGILMFHPNIVELKEYERGVFFRLGKYERVAGPGWVVYFSTIDTFVKVDLRTQVLDIDPQEVITQDNVKITIDSVIYFRIADPKKSVVEIRDFKGAVSHLIRAQLRTVIGRLLLEEVLEKTEEVNSQLFSVVKDVEDKWGIMTSRVEISSIELPSGLLSAMQKRREAGEYKEKMETEARAKQVSLEILDKALRSISDRTIAYLYLDVLKRVAEGKSNKIIFPLELTRLATYISEKSGWTDKGERKDFEEIAKTLLASYHVQQKESMDKKAGLADQNAPEGEAARK
ncbi:MAG TPA: SPFH domain-containing protein [Candidatus Norongarragalinales archaeon]|nr:SPFH domain-containing protein [Candidatus Norongarragalinales archaeon]